MSLSLFTGCCERSLLPGVAEADGTQAMFKVPSALNAQAGKCADFFMTTYSRSPFPRANITYVAFLSPVHMRLRAAWHEADLIMCAEA
jgi:hypothetical protein